MGAKPSSEAVKPGNAAGKTVKGVEYAEDGSIRTCIFCRIANGEEQNPIWFKDEHVTVFIPRGPAATLHLLVIPNEHVPDVNSIGPQHISLLRHMERVAREQLAYHAPHFDLKDRRLGRTAPPPTYLFPRGLAAGLTAPPVHSDPTNVSPAAHDSIPAAGHGRMHAAADLPAAPPLDDRRVVLCFHRPPFNSIDHLHLHALYKPYTGVRDSMHFLEWSRWVTTLTAVYDRLQIHIPGATK